MDQRDIKIVASGWRMLGLLGLLSLSGLAGAAKFDADLRVPAAISAKEVTGRLQNHFKRLAAPDPDIPNNFMMEAMLRDGASTEWLELRWHLNRMVDAARPMPELERLGLRSLGKGSYSVDLAQHPEWSPFQERLSLLGEPEAFEPHVARLLARGFRSSDVQTVRDYLQSHGARRTLFEATVELTETFAGYAQQRNRAAGNKQTRSSRAAQAWSFLYQRHMQAARAEQQWSAGLLAGLDPQRRRILFSYLMEELGGTKTLVPEAKSAVDAYIDQQMSSFISGTYVQDLQRQKAEVQRGN